MMTRKQQREYYNSKAADLQASISKLKARSRGFVTGEIVSFLAIFFFIVLITLSDSTMARTCEGMLAVVMFFLYVIIRNRDVKNSERIADTERLRKAYSNEVAYLDSDFSPFDDGQRYVDPKHPFTYDLDIFGKDSLYQRMNRTVTTGGADRLAYYLSHVDAHKSVGDIKDYSWSIYCLSNWDNWCIPFISYGVDEKIDTDAIVRSLPKLQDVNVPSFYGGKMVKAVAWLLIAGMLASIVAAIYGLVNPMLPILWVFVNFFVVQGLSNKYLKEMLSLGVTLKDQMQPLMGVISLCSNRERHVEEEPEDGDLPMRPMTSKVLEREFSIIDNAKESIGKLTDIVETLILRGNDAYRFFADAFGLRGVFLTCKFYHWRQMALGNLTSFISAISEIDVLTSMSQFAFLNPKTCEANFMEYPSVNPKFANKGMDGKSILSVGGFEVGVVSHVFYSAKGLYHPFLGENAVRNDFEIKDGNFYIITGANMAGKSTFLRAIGVNYVLAMNGMPVFANNLVVSRFNLFTSMRTSDDLAHGISYFNAELLRLKQLIESLSPSAYPVEREVATTSKLSNNVITPLPTGEGAGERLPTLIILDEILKGTNSLDKLNGSRMFLRAMEDKPVSGVIATHDLELSKMEQESPRFHNYCFEIELGDDVTYSYKITPGVARNQNATFLLKKLLSKQ